MRWGRFGWVVVVWVGVAGGQVLARKNWEGSGVTVEAWWSRGVFCAAGGDLKRVAGEMDALGRMGCDAVEVDPGQAGGPTPGRVGEMDGLVEAAGRGRMRVVVDLDGSGGEQEVRDWVGFWGMRGVAGFAVRGLGNGVPGRLRAGGRLLIGDGGQLSVRRLSEGDAAGMRAGLAAMESGRRGVLLEDGGERMSYARAAMVLLSGGAARVGVDAVLPGAVGVAEEFSPEEMLLWVPKKRVATDGMVDWVGRLNELHHGNASVRRGQAVFLNLDAMGVVGWMFPGRDGRGAIVVVCNVSGKAVRVAVAGEVRAGGVRGNDLKTLLRSDGSVGGGVSLERIELEGGGVFVGEVR